MGGFYGLDLNVMPEFWRRFRVHPSERDEVFADLLLMESEALCVMAEKRGRQ